MTHFHKSQLFLWGSMFYLLPMSSDQWVKDHVPSVCQGGAPSDHLEKLKTQWKKEQPQGLTIESVTESFWREFGQCPSQYKPL